MGRATITRVDEGMNVWSGVFEPADAYEDVREIFLEFARDSDGQLATDWYTRRDALGLELSRLIDDKGWLLIEDWSEVDADEPLRLVVQGIVETGDGAW